MLTLTFLGVGSAFSKRNFQSNVLIEAWSSKPQKQDAPDDHLLIDFGTRGPAALYQLREQPGFGYLDAGSVADYPALRRILITHLHSDHIGGLEELAGMNMFHFANGFDDKNRSKPQLYSTSEILTRLWNHCLRGGLGALDGREVSLEDYFQVMPIRSRAEEAGKDVLLGERYELSLFPTDHIKIRQKYDWPSFGVKIVDRQSNESVIYSGDTRFDSAGMGALLHKAKLIFHEVQLDEHPAPVHATFAQLRSLPVEIRQRTYLYHYGDAWDEPRFAFVADEFAGFAQPQKRYSLFD